MPIKPSEPGKVTCLSCDKEFMSPDKLRIRRCQKCKKGDADLSARELGLAAGDWPEGVRDELWRDY